jgi:hypothetical protein
MGRQLSLFGGKSLNPVGEVKRAMALAARECGLSRAVLVDEMNDLVRLEGLRTKGKDGLVTEAMLDKWLAPEARDYVIPLRFLPVFCRVAGSLAPLAALAAGLGAAVIGEADQVLLALARAQQEEKAAARRRRRLAEEYEEFEIEKK